MSSFATIFQTGCARMASNFSRWRRAYLNGLGQIAFAENSWAGLLVVAGVAALVPWGAAGAIIGGLVGTAAGRFQRNLSEPHWDAALSGFNPAIVGILWGLAYTAGAVSPAVLLPMIVGCIGIEYVMRPVFARAGLPLLSAPAMITAYLATAIVALSGTVFWEHLPPLLLGSFGLPLALAFVGVAMLTQSVKATILTAAAVAALHAVALVPGFSVLGAQGLWAFTIVPALFGLHGLFLAQNFRGGIIALLGAGVALVLSAR